MLKWLDEAALATVQQKDGSNVAGWCLCKLGWLAAAKSAAGKWPALIDGLFVFRFGDVLADLLDQFGDRERFALDLVDPFAIDQMLGPQKHSQLTGV